MNSISWSKYQQTIFKEIATGSGNVIIIARAGSAKTTSIVEGCKYLPKGKSAIFCAFNKSIQLELKEKLGDYVDTTTLHSLGYKTIKSKFPNIEINKEKTEQIIDSVIGKSKKLSDLKFSIIKTVSLCKATLTDVPSKIENLLEDYGIDICDLSKEKFISYTCQILRQCKENTKEIDFDDMVWFPFIYGIKPIKYDFVFIDECQDLNVAQIELALAAVKPNGRVFCVLDDFQSIYAWRGADSTILNKLKKRLSPKELSLPISYRCPKKVIYLAQKLVPDIQSFSGSPDGEINHIHPDNLQKYTNPGCFVLSRTNAPLISLCMKYVKKGIKANILGKDVGIGLSYLIKKSGKKTIPAFLSWLYKWFDVESENLRKKGKSNFFISDRVDCLQKICEDCATLEEVQQNIKNMFHDETGEDTVLFSTVHKSKGLERNDVFILYDTIRQDTQENKNIYYVALTRAKKRLFLVSKNN